ncbi:hypothetical protein ACH5RR_000618 [Cinchona calisaya]|uniref:Uncharacterized protein n=1 Tax=Cinchona calisaya TaxID=153742 RepID=A0ABD3B290_9GENT
MEQWSNQHKKLVEAGYRVIESSSGFYYLYCRHGDFHRNDSQYNQPPGVNQGDGGAEVALWSEQADPTVMDSGSGLDLWHWQKHCGLETGIQRV